MGKPAESISRGDEIQSGGNGLLEGFACASPGPAQHRLEFRERLFDGRQIWRVGRQKQQATATSFNGLLDPRREVDREIVQDHDLPGAQTGCKDLLDVDLKRSA